MSLPLELAPLVFEFLPVDTLWKFAKDDSLLISVLKIQLGCQPFKVVYTYSEETTYYKVHHMGYDLSEAFSEEVLSSLGLVHRIEFRLLPDAFASLMSKNDKADSYFFSRATQLHFRSTRRGSPNFSRIDLSMFPRLRSLRVGAGNRGVKIFPRSRTKRLSCLAIPGGKSSVEGVFDVSQSVYQYAKVDMNKDRSFIRMSYGWVNWKRCFDKSWCRSMELRQLTFSEQPLYGFSNLKILKFVECSIHSHARWLPDLPLETLIFWDCFIMGSREFGSFPIVKELEFKKCKVNSLQSHIPQLESFTLLDRDFLGHVLRAEDEGDIPIAKENLRNVKSLIMSTKATRVDLSSFEGLKHLKLLKSDILERLDGLNVDTLEWVTIERCPKLEVDFPCHVSVTVGNGFPDIPSS